MLEGKWSRPEKTTQNVKEEFTDSQKRALRAMFQECLADEEAKNGVRHDRDQANLKKVKAVLEEIKLPSDLIEEVLSIVSTKNRKIKVFDLGGAFVYLDKDTGHYDVSTDYNLAKNKNNGTKIRPVPAVYRNNILYGIIRVD